MNIVKYVGVDKEV